MVPDSFGGDETHEEAKEDENLFRGFGRTGEETRGQSDRHVETGDTSNRLPEWSRKSRSKATRSKAR